MIASDSAAGIRDICSVEPGELASADQVKAASDVYRDALLRTVETVVAGYAILADEQKARLREIYARETGHDDRER